MEERAVSTRANLVDDIRFEIDIERARDVLARRRLGKERREAVGKLGL